jgi:hypothetical protein
MTTMSRGAGRASHVANDIMRRNGKILRMDIGEFLPLRGRELVKNGTELIPQMEAVRLKMKPFLCILTPAHQQ